MNCQQFRQRCAFDPSCQDEAFVSHWQSCPDCAIFIQEIMRFEHVLVEAVKVEAPTDLIEQILTPQNNHLAVTPLWYQRYFYPLAATLLLTTVVLLYLLFGGFEANQTQNLKQILVAYLENEPNASLINKEVPIAELRSMFQAIGIKVTDEVGRVSFCKILELNGYTIAHMVLVENSKPINVFFIRDSNIIEQEHLVYKNLQGIILPAKHGNIAIMGSSTESLDKVANHIQQVVNWI